MIVGGRTGFAYAGTLDADAIADVLAQARDNVQFGTVDEYAALAEPDGVPVTEQPLWNDELAAYPTDDKIDLAKELEKLTSGIDHRIRVDDSNYADAYGESAVATTTGIRMSGRENGCYVSVSTLADEGEGDDAETQTGFGFSVGRSPDEFDLERAAKEAADRATRLLGATKPPSKRLTVVLDPFVTAQFLGVISSTLNGEAVVKGRSLFRERLGEQVASPLVTLIDDPTNPKAYTATDVDGEGLAARRNVLIEDGVLRQFVHNSYSARRASTVSTGNATRGGFAGTPGVGCLALSLVPGTRTQEELIADIDDGLLVQQMQGLHSGVNPISGDFSTGAAGLLITERRGRRAGPRVHHRVDAAAHAARHRRGRWRPRLAPDARRRDEPRHPRRHDVRSLRAHPVPTVPSRPSVSTQRAIGRHPHLADAGGRRARARRPAQPHDVERRLDHDARRTGDVDRRVGHRRVVHHRPQRDRRRGRARRPAAVSRGRRRGAAHGRRRDHRSVPHRAGAERGRPRGGGTCDSRAGRARVRASSVRSDAAQSQRTRAVANSPNSA